MLGAFSVGKTSLVKRFVESIFSEKYKTTIGVQILKKTISLDGENYLLMIWDIEGVDDIIEPNQSYIRGASGCFIVVDGTRPKTAEYVELLVSFVKDNLGDESPFCVLLNKADLIYDWKLSDAKIEEWESNHWTVLKTSAKTGENVETAFTTLLKKIVDKDAEKGTENVS